MRLVALTALCLSCVASLACSIQLVSPPLPAGPNTAASTQPATAAGVAGPTVQSPETTVTLSGVVRVPADYTGMGAGAARLRLLQTPIIDTNNRTIIDTNNKTIIDTNNKTIIDTNNKTIIDTNDKTIIDTNNKTIIDTNDKAIVDTNDKAILDPVFLRTDVPLAGAMLFLADASGAPLPGTQMVMSDQNGNFAFPGVPSGFTVMVVAQARHKTGRLAQFKTLARGQGQPAAVDTGSTLATSALLRDGGGRLGDFSPQQFQRLRASINEDVRQNGAPDLSDEKAVSTRLDQLTSNVGALREDVQALRAEMQKKNEAIDALLAALKARPPLPSPAASATAGPMPAPRPSPVSSAFPSQAPSPQPSVPGAGLPASAEPLRATPTPDPALPLSPSPNSSRATPTPTPLLVVTTPPPDLVRPLPTPTPTPAPARATPTPTPVRATPTPTPPPPLRR